MEAEYQSTSKQDATQILSEDGSLSDAVNFDYHIGSVARTP